MLALVSNGRTLQTNLQHIETAINNAAALRRDYGIDPVLDFSDCRFTRIEASWPLGVAGFGMPVTLWRVQSTGGQTNADGGTIIGYVRLSYSPVIGETAVFACDCTGTPTCRRELASIRGRCDDPRIVLIMTRPHGCGPDHRSTN